MFQSLQVASRRQGYALVPVCMDQQVVTIELRAMPCTKAQVGIGIFYMIFAVGVSLLGGVLVTQWMRLRQPVKLSLVEQLSNSAEPMRPSFTDLPPMTIAPKLWAHLDRISVEQHLFLSMGILGLTILGTFGVPFLRFLPTAGLLYLDLYFLRRAYVEWNTAGLIGVTDAIVTTGLLVTRQVGAGALFATLYFVSHQLVQRTQTMLAQQVNQYPQHTSAIELTLPTADGDRSASSVSHSLPLNQAHWQKVVHQGALPFLTLSAVTMPFLGVKQALAVLVTNFGYDYRVTAPLSTLTYIDLAAEHEIVITDWRAFEQLHHVDVLLLDEQLFTVADAESGEETVSLNQSTQRHILQSLQQAGRRECFIIQTSAVPTRVTQPNRTLSETTVLSANVTIITLSEASVLIPTLQAAGCTVGMVYCTPLVSTIRSLADVVIITQPATQLDIVQLTSEGAHIVMPTGQLAQVLALLQLTDQLDHNLKRGFVIALLPSLLSLSGIYFFHFGVFIPLLLDSGGLAVGVLNAQLPRLGRRSMPPAERMIGSPAARRGRN